MLGADRVRVKGTGRDNSFWLLCVRQVRLLRAKDEVADRLDAGRVSGEIVRHKKVYR